MMLTRMPSYRVVSFVMLLKMFASGKEVIRFWFKSSSMSCDWLTKDPV